MPRTRRVIRKSRPNRYQRLDDQLWPLLVAFCVLGGFLCGTVLAYLRLDDPRWYANAWTWLVAIPILIAGLFTWLTLTGSRMLRRTMQLALVLGLIVHLLLLIFAVETDIFGRIWEEVATATQQLQRKEVRVPEYSSWQHDPQRRAERDFEQPVETELPEPQADDAEPQELDQPPSVVDPQPLPVVDPVRDVDPSVVKRRVQDQATPRRREQQSQFSRQLSQVPPQPVQSVTVPDVLRRAERRQPSLDATSTPMQPQLAEASGRRPSSQPQPRAAEQPDTAQLARRSPERAPPTQDTAAVALDRQLNRPRMVPRSDVQSPARPAISQQTQADALRPNNTQAEKQQTRSPDVRNMVEQPALDIPQNVDSRVRPRQQPAEERPVIARAPQPRESRRARNTSRPDVSTTADRATSRPPSESTPQPPQPTDAPVTRAAADFPSTARRTAGTNNNSAREAVARSNRRETEAMVRPRNDLMQVRQPRRRPSPSQPIGSVPTRVSPESPFPTATSSESATAAAMMPSPTELSRLAEGSVRQQRRQPTAELRGATPTAQSARRSKSSPNAAQPSVAPSADLASMPRRASRDAALSTPTAAENPVESVSPSAGATAEASPAQLAVDKGMAGAAGVGERPNLGRAEPAASSPAAVVSGSIARPRTTQTMPFGPAMSPSAPAVVRRNRAGRSQPSATLQATPLAVTTRHGSQQPADLNASASAALTEAASNADAGPVTAARGRAEIDLGPTTVVSRGGQGPAAGGGQPETSPGTEAAQIPRSRSGETQPASIATNSIAEVPAAPLSEGAAAADPARPSASPDAVVNSRPGPAAPTAGARPAAEGTALQGPETLLNNAEERSDRAAVAMGSSDTSERTMALPRTSLRDRNLDVEPGAADLGDAIADTAGGREATLGGVPSPAALSVRKREAEGDPGRGRSEASGDRAEQQAATPGDGLAERAEAAAGTPGLAMPGGGTRSPIRENLGPRVVANTQASTVELQGDSPSSGRNEDQPRQSLSDRTASVAGGLNAPRPSGPVGAERGELPVDTEQVADPGSGASTVAQSIADQDGPVISDPVRGGGPSRRTPLIPLPSVDSTAASNAPQSGAMSAEDPESGLVAGSLEVGRLDRSSSSGLTVDVQAPAGPGGLGPQATVDVGIDSRRARESSEVVKLEGTRFARQQVGGVPDFNTAVVVSAEPFRRRAARGAGEGPGPKTEEAIELGLVFLSRCQEEDGRWRLDRFAGQDGLPQMTSDSAATALVLLAFQGAGYNHLEHRYADTVKRGIEYLVENQQADGDLFVPADDYSNQYVKLYSHSIAALALSEAYGMTQDPALRESAQKALDFIVATQHERGGWRYAVGRGSDTSVTGWMMMALKSGELANLSVDSQVYARIAEWLDRAQASAEQPYLYCYNPYADPRDEAQAGGTLPTRTMTSVGLLMRLYLGWRRDNQNLELGARYLLEKPPALGTNRDPQRDTYYWYYATQVLFHMGGQYWKAWQERLHPLLVDSQLREGQWAGSWDPANPLPDRWGPQAGRLYVTTMNLLSLEVQYRHLPLYDDTAR